MKFDLPKVEPKKPPKQKTENKQHTKDNPHVMIEGKNAVIIFRFSADLVKEAHEAADKAGISLGSWYEIRLREFLNDN